MDIRKIKKLIELLEESGIAEIEIKEGEEALRISRMPSGTVTHQLPAMASLPLAAPLAPPPVSAATPRAAEPAAPKAKANEHVITAPMVGTFYASASPGAKPFIEIGDEIKVGQVLCIIEAMKLMNDLEAEVAGEIVRIYVENGQPVEYGQSLFAIKPSHKK